MLRRAQHERWASCVGLGRGFFFPFFGLADEEVLEAGDLLAVMTAGAYGSAQSGTYNSRPLIAEVLVKGSKFDLVRPRQTYEELIGLDHIASWQEKRRA